MEGHFHITLNDPELNFDQKDDDETLYINEEALSVAIEKAQKDGRKVETVVFICSFGCGMLHPLTEEEKSVVSAAFPYVKHLTEPVQQ